MKYVFFFATTSDITPVLRRLDQNEPLKYIQTGKRREINRPIYLDSSEIPDRGISTHETGNASTTYMVSPRDVKNIMYTFKNNDGQRRWLLSNGDNPDSVLLTMAGVWKTGTLLPGNMSTLHNTASAQRIMKSFLSAVRAEHFVKYNVFWFGKEAIEWLRAGRLVQAEQSPRSFDIPPPWEWPQRR